MFKTNNAQLNHLLTNIEDVVMPTTVMLTITMLVEEVNHQAKLLAAMTPDHVD